MSSVEKTTKDPVLARFIPGILL